MIIQTKISFREYVKLLFSLTYKRPIMFVLMGVALLMVLWIAFYYLDILKLPQPLIYQYITLVLISVVQPIVIFLTIRRNYYSSSHLREMLELNLTEDKVCITGNSFYMEIFWHKMFRIVELPEWFMFYQNNLSAVILPKKMMSLTEISALRNILANISDVPVVLQDAAAG